MDTDRRNSERTQKRIVRLHRLEAQAAQLSLRLGLLRDQWETTYKQVIDTPEWRADCAASGIAEEYNFGDVLA